MDTVTPDFTTADYMRRARKYYAESEGRSVTQSEWAELLGVAPNVVSNWEGGRYRPRPEHLLRVSKLTGISIEWLISGYDDLRRGCALSPLGHAAGF